MVLLIFQVSEQTAAAVLNCFEFAGRIETSQIKMILPIVRMLLRERFNVLLSLLFGRPDNFEVINDFCRKVFVIQKELLYLLQNKTLA